MKARDFGRWRAAQMTRFFFSIANRELHTLLWEWRYDLGIDEHLLREPVETQIRLALRSMSGEQYGFWYHPVIERQYAVLRSQPVGAPFISPRDLCLLLWLPIGGRATEMFGPEVSQLNLSMFFAFSTPLAIVNQADVARDGCLSVDVSCADWLDVERAYEQIYGIRWANDYLHSRGLLPEKVGTRGRPKGSHNCPPELFVPPAGSTFLCSEWERHAPAPYVTHTRPAIQGFPTYDDHFCGKTHIVVTGCSRSQIKAVWPQVQAYRKQRYSGFDPSHPSHRPVSIFALEKDALLSANYEAAVNKKDWLYASASAQGIDIDIELISGAEPYDSILRRVRRANARFVRPDK